VAQTLEHSARLAEEHAAREHAAGHHASADQERFAARHAHHAAARSHDLALRHNPTDSSGHPPNINNHDDTSSQAGDTAPLRSQEEGVSSDMPAAGAAAPIPNHLEVSQSVLEAFAAGSLDVFDEVLSPDFVDHDPQNPFAADRRGPQLMRAAAILYRTAFPDLVLVIEAQYEAGDVVITRWTASGTQMGGLPGLPPTRGRIAVSGVQIDRFEDDTIVESWRYWDTLGMLQQLGAIPTPRPPAA
jgi:predicted ester cyclase